MKKRFAILAGVAILSLSSCDASWSVWLAEHTERSPRGQSDVCLHSLLPCCPKGTHRAYVPVDRFTCVQNDHR